MRGWWWEHVSRHWSAESICWRIAHRMPRKIALLCFVRVYAGSSEPPTLEYARVYNNWRNGGGR